MTFLYTNFVYNILYKSIVTISILIVAMIIILVIINIYNSNKEKKQKKLTEKYVDWISSYVTDEPIKIRKLRTNLEFETFTEVCNNTLIDISGEHALKVRELTKMLRVVEYYRKMSKSRNWAKRYMAMEKLGYLKDPSLKHFYIDFMNNGQANPKVCLKTLIALSFIADKEILYIITNKLKEMLDGDNVLSAKIIEHIYNNAIKVLKMDNKIDEIKDFLTDIEFSKTIPKVIIKDVLTSCGTLKLAEVNQIIIDYFNNSYDVEVRAAAIKALGKIALPESHDTILKALKDESWVVRLVAAKASVICGYNAAESLQELLNDSHHYVRLNAAKSLAFLGENGLRLLRDKQDSENEYVSNTVKYVLDLNLNHVLY